jgi:tetratricopeptide (TPR) repeat protein
VDSPAGAGAGGDQGEGELGASFMAAMVLSLIGGIIAREMEVRQTRLALEESNAIAEFLVDLMEHASPLRLEGDEILLQDIIDRGSEQLSERFADQPAVHARMLHTLGRIYGERGDYPYGGKLMEEALALMHSAGVNNPEDEVRLLSDLGVSYRRQGRMEESQAVLQDGLLKARALSPAQPLLEAEMENSLGNIYVVTEDYPRAETHHSRALALRQAELAPGDLKITSSRNNLASVLINSWQLDRALPYAQQTLAEWTAGLPAGHPWIGIARNNLSIIFDRLGMKQEALELQLEALADSQQRLGPDHPDVADIWRNISHTLMELGRRQEGREAMEEYVRILSGSLGPGSPRTLAAERRTAALDLFDQHYARALHSLDSIRERLPPNDKDSNLSMQVEFDRVRALMGLHRYDEARGILQSIENAQGTNYLEQHRLAALVSGETGAPETAIHELQDLQKLAQQDLPERDPIHGGILMDLTHMAMESGDYAQAIDFASRAYAFWKSIHRASQTLQAQQWLGRAYIEAGQRSMGLQQLTEAAEGLRNFLPADHPYLLDVETRLAEYSSSP